MGRRRHTTGSARHHDDGGVANAPPLGSERHHTSTEVYDIDGSTKGTSPHHHVALPVHKDTSGSWKVLYAVGGWMVSHFQKRRNKSSRKKSRNHGEDSKEFRAMVMVAFVVALMAVLLGGRNGTVGETPMHPALGPMGFDPKEAENRENYLNRFAVVHDAKTGSLYISPNKGTKKELYMNKILTEIGEHGVALTMITKHLVPCTIYNGTNSGLEKWMDRYPVLGGDRDPTGVLRNAMQYVSDEMDMLSLSMDFRNLGQVYQERGRRQEAILATSIAGVLEAFPFRTKEVNQMWWEAVTRGGKRSARYRFYLGKNLVEFVEVLHSSSREILDASATFEYWNLMYVLSYASYGFLRDVHQEKSLLREGDICETSYRKLLVHSERLLKMSAQRLRAERRHLKVQLFTNMPTEEVSGLGALFDDFHVGKFAGKSSIYTAYKIVQDAFEKDKVDAESHLMQLVAAAYLHILQFTDVPDLVLPFQVATQTSFFDMLALMRKSYDLWRLAFKASPERDMIAFNQQIQVSIESADLNHRIINFAGGRARKMMSTDMVLLPQGGKKWNVSHFANVVQHIHKDYVTQIFNEDFDLNFAMNSWRKHPEDTSGVCLDMLSFLKRYHRLDVTRRGILKANLDSLTRRYTHPNGNQEEFWHKVALHFPDDDEMRQHYASWVANIVGKIPIRSTLALFLLGVIVFSYYTGKEEYVYSFARIVAMQMLSLLSHAISILWMLIVFYAKDHRSNKALKAKSRENERNEVTRRVEVVAFDGKPVENEASVSVLDNEESLQVGTPCLSPVTDKAKIRDLKRHLQLQVLEEDINSSIPSSPMTPMFSGNVPGICRKESEIQSHFQEESKEEGCPSTPVHSPKHEFLESKSTRLKRKKKAKKSGLSARRHGNATLEDVDQRAGPHQDRTEQDHVDQKESLHIAVGASMETNLLDLQQKTPQDKQKDTRAETQQQEQELGMGRNSSVPDSPFEGDTATVVEQDIEQKQIDCNNKTPATKYRVDTIVSENSDQALASAWFAASTATANLGLDGAEELEAPPSAQKDRPANCSSFSLALSEISWASDAQTSRSITSYPFSLGLSSFSSQTEQSLSHVVSEEESKSLETLRDIWSDAI